MMRRILVLGGTGAMGRHLVGILVQNEDNEVVVTTRSHRRGYGNLKYACGNAHDLHWLSALLSERWDYVIDFMSYTTEEFSRRVDLLLDSTGRYFFLSSARVYADSGIPLTEESPRLLDACGNQAYLVTDEYALAKARQEDALARNERRNWTIIRPYITFSEERLQLGEMEKEEWLFIALKRGVIPFSRDVMEKFTTLTYGRDVALGIAFLMEREDSVSGTYQLTSGESMRWEQVLNTYTSVLDKVLGKEIQVQLTDMSRNFNTGKKWQLRYDRLYDRIFSTDKMSLCDAGAEQTPVLERLAACLELFLSSERKFHANCWGMLGKFDREHGCWENVLCIPGWKNKARYIAWRVNLR